MIKSFGKILLIQRLAKIAETQNDETQWKTITLISPRICSHFGFRKFLLAAVLILAHDAFSNEDEIYYPFAASDAINHQQHFKVALRATPEAYAYNKRKRPDFEELGENKRRKVAFSKAPILSALLQGVKENIGASFIDKSEGQIEVNDFFSLMSFIEENNGKKTPANCLSNRLKSLKKCFHGIPEKRELDGNANMKFTIILKREKRHVYNKIINKLYPSDPEL